MAEEGVWQGQGEAGEDADAFMDHADHTFAMRWLKEGPWGQAAQGIILQVQPKRRCGKLGVLPAEI